MIRKTLLLIGVALLAIALVTVYEAVVYSIPVGVRPEVTSTKQGPN